MDPRVAIKALDDLSRSVGWQLLLGEFTTRRTSWMNQLVNEGVAAQTRDELAAAIRTVNTVLNWPALQMERITEAMPQGADEDG